MGYRIRQIEPETKFNYPHQLEPSGIFTGCKDADDGLRWYGLVALSRSLAERDIPTYLEPYRRGGHLWLFPETPLLSTEMRR
jgi:hypothetical protein